MVKEVEVQKGCFGRLTAGNRIPAADVMQILQKQVQFAKMWYSFETPTVGEVLRHTCGQ